MAEWAFKLWISSWWEIQELKKLLVGLVGKKKFGKPIDGFFQRFFFSPYLPFISLGHFWKVWATLSKCGPLWANVGHFGHVWATLSNSGPAWATDPKDFWLFIISFLWKNSWLPTSKLAMDWMTNKLILPLLEMQGFDSTF